MVADVVQAVRAGVCEAEPGAAGAWLPACAYLARASGGDTGLLLGVCADVWPNGIGTRSLSLRVCSSRSLTGQRWRVGAGTASTRCMRRSQVICGAQINPYRRKTCIYFREGIPAHCRGATSPCL